MNKITQLTDLYYKYIEDMKHVINGYNDQFATKNPGTFSNNKQFIRIVHKVNIYDNKKLFVTLNFEQSQNVYIDNNSMTPIFFYDLHKGYYKEFKEKVINLNIKDIDIIELIEVDFCGKYLDILRNLNNQNVKDRIHMGTKDYIKGKNSLCSEFHSFLYF